MRYNIGRLYYEGILSPPTCKEDGLELPLPPISLPLISYYAHAEY